MQTGILCADEPPSAGLLLRCISLTKFDALKALYDNDNNSLKGARDYRTLGCVEKSSRGRTVSGDTVYIGYCD